MLLVAAFFRCKGLTTQELLDGNFIPATKVKIIEPADGSLGFVLNGKIFVSPDGNLKLASLQENATIVDANGNKVDFVASDRGGGVYTLAPSSSLQSLTKYTVTIPTTVLDSRNKAIAASATVSFTTYGQLTISSHNFGSALPETTTSHNASITLNQSVTGMALSANALSVTTDTGCMNCVTLSNLSGSGAGPYTFTINGLLSANTYYVRIGSAVADAAGNQANMQFAFYVAPVISLVKNPKEVYSFRGAVHAESGLT